VNRASLAIAEDAGDSRLPNSRRAGEDQRSQVQLAGQFSNPEFIRRMRRLLREL